MRRRRIAAALLVVLAMITMLAVTSCKRYPTNPTRSKRSSLPVLAPLALPNG